MLCESLAPKWPQLIQAGQALLQWSVQESLWGLLFKDDKRARKG